MITFIVMENTVVKRNNNTIDPESMASYSKPGPRYTSYPPAPVWKPAAGDVWYKKALRSAGQSKFPRQFSLYFHIPFCRARCFFCGCNVAIRQKQEEADKYIDYVEKELNMVADWLAAGQTVVQLHWGGGTPTFLTVDQIRRLNAIIKSIFAVDMDAEVAVETDPCQTSLEQLDALIESGFNRISIGVQDFDPAVQKAVNRIQSYRLTADHINHCRKRGVHSINVDLIYGLPFQNAENFAETVKKIIDLKIERIALYSFAYIPWIKPHQKGIPKEALPVPVEKARIFLKARDLFLNADYEQIGMDHFALQSDELSLALKNKRLYRNFMGYTIQRAEQYLGFGSSSIGYIQSSFFQNQREIKDYYRAIDEGKIPVMREYRLTGEDKIRQWVIMTLMCQTVISFEEFNKKFNVPFFEHFHKEKESLIQAENEGLIIITDDELKLTETGRVLMRNVAMIFDQYLPSGEEKTKPLFSQTV